MLFTQGISMLCPKTKKPIYPSNTAGAQVHKIQSIEPLSAGAQQPPSASLLVSWLFGVPQQEAAMAGLAGAVPQQEEVAAGFSISVLPPQQDSSFFGFSEPQQESELLITSPKPS
jgi:hypothetical protein